MSGRVFEPGDWVVYRGGDNPEYGVIIWSMLNEHDDEDCWIAFFGDRFPEIGEDLVGPKRPYILRYYAASLEFAKPPERSRLRVVSELYPDRMMACEFIGELCGLGGSTGAFIANMEQIDYGERYIEEWYEIYGRWKDFLK